MPLASYFARLLSSSCLLTCRDLTSSAIIQIGRGKYVNVNHDNDIVMDHSAQLSEHHKFCNFRSMWREKTVTAVSRSTGPFRLGIAFRLLVPGGIGLLGMRAEQSAQGAHSRTILFERAIT